MSTFRTATQTEHLADIWDEVHDSRETFLAYLKAQCAPGQPVGPIPTAPKWHSNSAANTAFALALTLFDEDTSLAINTDTPADFAWLYEATGASQGSLNEADFVVATRDLETVLSSAKRGTAHRPETGATVIAVVDEATPVTATLNGPGIEGEITLPLPLSAAVIDVWATANATFPMGVDLVIAQADQIIALPRSCRMRLETN